MRRLPLVLAAIAAVSCGGDEAGVEGTEILQDYGSLSGGIVFASAAIIDSNDYDLYWAPVPLQPTTLAQPLARLTNAKGHEWQPSVARSGKGIVFAREKDGIFLINISGRITRVSDTRGKELADSLPSLSFDGTHVAWVREDTTRPIRETDFFETYIMVADFDGNNAHPAEARAGNVQDAPVWEPIPNSTRLAWSEFGADSIGGFGPSVYGVYTFNLATGTGRFVCQDPERDLAPDFPPGGYRCFGQHLAWPIPSTIVTGQTLIEIDVNTGGLATQWPEIVSGVLNQQLGTPFIGPSPYGFFPAFPLSVSFSPDRMIVDGVITEPIEGEEDTLAFFVASWDGGGVWRLEIDGFRNDRDNTRTRDFLFSVATPQFVP